MDVIYPDSHQLRPVSLLQVNSPLVPEGMLALAALEQSEHAYAFDIEAQAQLLEEVSASLAGKAAILRASFL